MSTEAERRKLFTADIVVPALWASLRKLDPRVQIRNPVMFVVWLGSAITTAIFLVDLVQGETGSLAFTGVVALWLWLTVIFANLAEAIAEGRGKAQANALRATRSEMMARRLYEGDAEELDPRGRPAPRRPGGVRGGRPDPGRRRRRGRGGLGGRVGDHRRVGPGHPRVGRRPQRGDRRHARPVGPDRGAHHPGAGRQLPRPHDRPRRGHRRGARRPTRSPSTS